MKIIATPDGLAMVLTLGDNQNIAKATKGTTLTPRALVELLASHYTNNLEADASDLAEYHKAGYRG